MSEPIRGQAAILFFRSARKTQTWYRALRSCFLSSFVEFHSAVSTEKSKMSQPIRGWGGHLVFPISPKNTNLVEDVKILLPIKFRWIRFSGFREEVENVSANQRPGQPSCFSDRLKNTNLVEEVEILLPVKFRWIPFSGFRGEVENVSANQRPGRPSCFSDRPEKHKLGRGRWDLASCQVSLNSVQRFQRRSWKCESLRTTDADDRRTDDGRCAMTIAHLSLRLRWAKNHTKLSFYCDNTEANIWGQLALRYTLGKHVSAYRKQQNKPYHLIMVQTKLGDFES